MGVVSRWVEILRKNQKKMLEMEKTAVEMKSAFYDLIRKLDTMKEEIA